jgi:hypothetical protein
MVSRAISALLIVCTCIISLPRVHSFLTTWPAPLVHSSAVHTLRKFTRTNHLPHQLAALPFLNPTVTMHSYAERKWLERGRHVNVIARWVALWLVGLVGKLVLQWGNKFYVERAQLLRDFVLRRACRGTRPLLSVSNHCSVFDDPVCWYEAGDACAGLWL